MVGVWGATAGVNIDASLRPRADNSFAMLLLSLATGERTVLHLNGGINRARGSQARATWGAAAEVMLGPRTALVAETYGEHRSRPLFQLGGRTWIEQDVWQLDATFGGQRGGGRDARFFTIGITAVAEKLLRR